LAIDTASGAPGRFSSIAQAAYQVNDLALSMSEDLCSTPW
jgi:hypothetical protein